VDSDVPTGVQFDVKRQWSVSLHRYLSGIHSYNFRLRFYGHNENLNAEISVASVPFEPLIPVAHDSACRPTLQHRRHVFLIKSEHETLKIRHMSPKFLHIYHSQRANNGRSHWPCGLRRVSAAARLLGLRVRIPPWAWVSVVCCEVEVSATCWSHVQRSSTECVCVCVCLGVIVKPLKCWGTGALGGRRTMCNKVWEQCDQKEKRERKMAYQHLLWVLFIVAHTPVVERL